jgi:hypothetical protein
LLAVVPNVTLAVCRQLNALTLGTSTTAAPPQEVGDFDGTTKIAGFNATATGELVSDAGSVMYGKRDACFQANNIDGASAVGTYWYYHVLLVR